MVTLTYGSILELHIYIPTTGMTPDTGFLDRLLLATNGRMYAKNTVRFEGVGERVYGYSTLCTAGCVRF